MKEGGQDGRWDAGITPVTWHGHNSHGTNWERGLPARFEKESGLEARAPRGEI